MVDTWWKIPSINFLTHVARLSAPGEKGVRAYPFPFKICQSSEKAKMAHLIVSFGPTRIMRGNTFLNVKNDIPFLSVIGKRRRGSSLQLYWGCIHYISFLALKKKRILFDWHSLWNKIFLTHIKWRRNWVVIQLNNIKK